MRDVVTVHYVVNGATLSDTIEGTDISVQYDGKNLDLRFPNRDGAFLTSGITSLVGRSGMRAIVYAAAMHAVIA